MQAGGAEMETADPSEDEPAAAVLQLLQGYSFLTFSAAGPFCPCTTSNSTRSPSARLL
jgi:hypothetical protein